MQAAEEESDPHAALRHAAVANKRGISPTGLASRRSVCSGRWGRGEGPVRAHRQMGSAAEAKLALLWALGGCAQLAWPAGGSREICCLDERGHVPPQQSAANALCWNWKVAPALPEGWDGEEMIHLARLGPAPRCREERLPCSQRLARTAARADSGALCCGGACSAPSRPMEHEPAMSPAAGRRELCEQAREMTKARSNALPGELGARTQSALRSAREAR